MKEIGHILLAVLLGLGVLTQAGTEKSPAVLFQEALYQEETEGNLDKAIELYGQVIEQAADVERVAARAAYQIGMCHLKKGEKEKAADYFQQVVSQYPKQTSILKKAKKQLNKLRPASDIIAQSYVIHYRTINSSEDGLTLFNQRHPKGVRTHHASRYRQNGETISSICTDSSQETDKIVEMLKQHPQLELVKVVSPQEAGKRLIRHSFEDANRWEKGQAVDGVAYIWDRKHGSDGKSSLCLKKNVEKYFPIAQWTRKIDHTGDAKELAVSAQVQAKKAYKAVIDALFLDDKGEWIKHEWVSYIGAKEAGDKPANHKWKEYAGKVEIPENTKTIVIGLQMYGPGTVWFDELEVAYVGTSQRAEEYAQKIKQSITVNVNQSPDGDRLTVQYAAIAIAKAAGVPYQWDKSTQLAEPERRQYIKPLEINGTATGALNDLLSPIGLSYGIDKNGLYLCRKSLKQTEDIDRLIKELGNPQAPRFKALNELIDLGEPAVEPLLEAMKKSNNWQIPKALGAIGDKRAVGPLINKWEKANFSPMKEVIDEALERITEQKHDQDLNAWKTWWDEVKHYYTPQATIQNFMNAALEFDIENAMRYIAPDSHDFADIKEVLEDPDNPFYVMFKKADTSIPVKVTKADISDTMCSAIWEFTVKEDINLLNGKITLKAGDPVELDGNLHLYGDKWLITGI